MPKAKKKPATRQKSWKPPFFAGRQVALAGKSFWWNEEFAAMVCAEGGTFADSVSDAVHVLVVGQLNYKKPTREEKKAEQLNRAGASIRIVSEHVLREEMMPDAEQVQALLGMGSKGAAIFKELQAAGQVKDPLKLKKFQGRGLNLSGLDLTALRFDQADLRGAKLDKARLAYLYQARLEGADLRGALVRDANQCNLSKARLEGAALANLEDCNLDGTNLTGAATEGTDRVSLTRCSLKNADLRKLQRYRIMLQDCNLSGAQLSGSKTNNFEAPGSIFTRAKLDGTQLFEAKLNDADLSGASLKGACLARADLTRARLPRANLRGADLTHANLSCCDLSGADLRDACLAGANLEDAIVAGANFRGAYLCGAKLDKVDVVSAKGLAADLVDSLGEAGPCVDALDKAMRKDDWLDMSARIEVPGRTVTIEICRYGPQQGRMCSKVDATWQHTEYPQFPFPQAVRQVTEIWTRGRLRIESISAGTHKKKIPQERLDELVRAAWCELFGCAAPTDSDLENQHEALRQEMLAELRGGEEGVSAWNRRPDTQYAVLNDLALDLSKAELRYVRLEKMRVPGARFTGANLAQAWLGNSDFSRADFRKANLFDTLLHWATFQAACFDDSKTSLQCSDCRQATFKNADLTGAKLEEADLCGADLSGARLGDVLWKKARFDEHTHFPSGFVPSLEMRWQGQGPHPGLPAVAGSKIDLDSLLLRLKTSTEPGRLANALKMLRSDRFQLFVELNDSSLIGVVKSQTDKNLVYSCRLANDGTFSCGTQNLRPCGGLGGLLCKHLLVLIVGLARAGQFDPAKADAWVQASRVKKPSLDKDAMSETFLRYKGAEAGEVDWRPTETIPEDYYAL
ncbi:MAG: pentapeptide repeat-containing protein [Gemmataceae bacterium]